VVLVILFAIRGYARGMIGQIFALAALLAGVWVAILTSQWVGVHWQGARPAVVFLALRWLVAGLAGLAIATLLQWAGEKLREAVHAGPAAWLDRSLGVVVGAGVAVLVITLILVVALIIPRPHEVADVASRAKVAPTLMTGGARACALGRGLVPGSRWLGYRFAEAGRRAKAHDRSL
jgi:uncharacterized membrane protein required for colicin V production